MQNVFLPNLLQGQHAFITGGGSGINLRIAQRFAQQGAKISIVGRSLEKAQKAAKEIRDSGGNAQGYGADVRDMSQLQSAVSHAVSEHGPIHIGIAGAAGNFVALAEKMSANGFKTVTDIDLNGTFNTFHAIKKHLTPSSAHLIAISAVQAHMPVAAQAHVCAAKAGIEMLVKTLCLEWSRDGVRCNAIAPGPVAETEGMARLAPGGDSSWEKLLSGIPMGRAANSDEIADVAMFLVSGAAAYINGTTICIDGGQTNLGSMMFGQVLKDSLEVNYEAN